MNMSKQHTHTQEAVAEVRTVADSKSEYSELCRQGFVFERAIAKISI